MKKILLALLVGIPVIAFPFPLFAQQNIASAGPALGGTTEKSPELTSCFDYYKFGSTPIGIRSDVNKVTQGGTITFKGTITNNNAYPLSGLGIYGKVLHTTSLTKSSFGPDVVDWVTVAKDINLKAGESKQVEFTWKVPSNAPVGSYSLGLFVAEFDRFNLLGLSFTNDILGAKSDFTVVGNDAGFVGFDVEKITLNGHQVHGAAYPIYIGTSTPANVSAVLVNNTAASVPGTVHWRAYRWDALQSGHLVSESSQDVTLAAHATQSVSYTVQDTSHTVYYVIGEFVPQNENFAHSFINPRYVYLTNNEPRINFAGISKYPGDEGTTVYACIHSSGQSDAPNVELKLTAYPSNPIIKLLGIKPTLSRTFTGTLSGAIQALTIPVTKSLGDSFIVRAQIYQNNALIDDVSVPYTCQSVGTPCGPAWQIIVGVVLAVLILLTILGMVLFRKRPQQNYTNTSV